MSTSYNPSHKRAHPLLGTLVEIRVDGLSAREANAAIDAGFAAIADIHRLMSFHEAASDVSRLNRDAAAMTIAVDPRTFEVIRAAQEMAKASDGIFDISTAGRLVDWGFLPTPDSSHAPAPQASWRDILLEAPSHIRFARPLWIDLGGIAKGYAVDQALAAMALAPQVQCCINAGGDLRVAGPEAEPVQLRLPVATGAVPVIEIADGALASSSGREHRREYHGQVVGPHVDGRQGTAVDATTFASVTANNCITADALTKVVLACGAKAEPLLRSVGAVAYLHDMATGWVTLGERVAGP